MRREEPFEEQIHRQDRIVQEDALEPPNPVKISRSTSYHEPKITELPEVPKNREPEEDINLG